MILTAFDMITISLYVLVMLWVAFRTRKSPEFSDFALARKQLPYALIFASLASTYIGPGFSMGAVSKGAETGYYSLFLFLPFALQTTLVGFFLAPKLAELSDCASIGDLMGMKYGRETQFLTGVSSVGICVMFTAFLAKVAGELLSNVANVPFSLGVLIVTALSLSYTLFGGIRASVITDSIQFGIFTVVIGCVAVGFVLMPDFSLVNAERLAFRATSATWSSASVLAVVGVGLSFLLGETLIPPYASRALASSSPQASKRSFILAGVFCVFWLAAVTAIGIGAASIGIPTSLGDQTLIASAVAVLPNGFLGLLLVAMFGILMSSQDSVLNAGAVAFTRDLVRPLFPVTDRLQMNIGRIGTGVIAVLGAICAGWLPRIIDALVLIYSLWAPTVLGPFVLAILVRRPGRHSGWMAILSGGLTSILWTTAFAEPMGIPAILPAMIVSLLALTIGFLMGRSEESKSMEFS